MFSLNTGYTNACINDRARKLAFNYSNYIINIHAKNPEKCSYPLALGLHNKYRNYWSTHAFCYLIPTHRTSYYIWMQSPFWGNNTKRFKLRIDSLGKEYILTGFGKVHSYDCLPISVAQLEQFYKEMRDLMKWQLGYIINLEHLEEYNYVYFPGHIKITSVEELQNYYGGIAKALESY